jgi:hypothetical protein
VPFSIGHGSRSGRGANGAARYGFSHEITRSERLAAALMRQDGAPEPFAAGRSRIQPTSATWDVGEIPCHKPVAGSSEKRFGDNYESVIASHFRVPRACHTDYADAWAGHSVLRSGREAQ